MVKGEDVGDVFSSLLLVAQVQVIKGDTQKADSAAVPEQHLWVYAFLCKYGHKGYGPRHLRALGLPPTALVGGLLNSTSLEGWEVTASGLSNLALFRLLALHRWRRQVLCVAWFICYVEGQMVCPFLNSQGGEGRVHFGWSSEGKVPYMAQWELVRSHLDSLAMRCASHNAVWQSAHASWFE